MFHANRARTHARTHVPISISASRPKLERANRDYIARHLGDTYGTHAHTHHQHPVNNPCDDRDQWHPVAELHFVYVRCRAFCAIVEHIPAANRLVLHPLSSHSYRNSRLMRLEGGRKLRKQQQGLQANPSNTFQPSKRDEMAGCGGLTHFVSPATQLAGIP